jgi:hypothetical protein
MRDSEAMKCAKCQINSFWGGVEDKMGNTELNGKNKVSGCRYNAQYLRQ